MKTFLIDGATVQVPGLCDCGALCTEEEARREVSGWNKSAYPCSFCGRAIRVSRIALEHHHLLGPKDWSPLKKHPHVEAETVWGSEGGAQYEPNWQWMAHGSWGDAGVRAHVSCAKAAMPFGNFMNIDYNRPEGIPDGCAMPATELKPCATCGAVPTDLDVARIAGRIYSFAGPCVYCGGPIKVESIDLFHGTWAGKHTGQWHFENYKREESLTWCGYRVEGSRHMQLEFSGHLRCAKAAMPSLEFRA